MQIVALGLDHERAPVEVREHVAIPSARIKEAIAALSDYVSNGIVLSTCNRTEVYVLEDDLVSAVPGMERFFCEYSGVKAEELLPRLFRERQEGAVRHLFRVASGLESLIVGEYEVLGQLRHVLVEAEGLKSVDPFLLSLLREAVRVGRRVRSETAISRNAASVSSAAVEIARKVFPELSDCRVLVLGAGQAGKVAVQSLVDSQVAKVAVMSRSLEHAAELADSLGGTAVPYHRLKETLVDTDIVICCTGSPHFVLEPAALSDAVSARNGRPLLLIDIAVPRDIDPAVKTLDNIMLYDIDDLEGVARTNRRLREGEVTRAAGIVDEEAARFMAWWRGRQATPAIAALLSKAETIRSESFDKTVKGMSNLSAEDRVKIEAMTKSIVQKILHAPVTALKGNGGESKLVRDLFGLDVPD
ncbi:MAG: glutamyl-tRNA reductase [Chloroflexi bacterium]|nr:glutamyl-tRNA reductase [Chloroflexota bacterium]